MFSICLLKKCCTFASKQGQKMAGGGGGGRTIPAEFEAKLDKIRRFRDEVLEEHRSGRIFEWMYYHVFSPPAVVVLKCSSTLRDLVNERITPYLAEKCEGWVDNFHR